MSPWWGKLLCPFLHPLSAPQTMDQTSGISLQCPASCPSWLNCPFVEILQVQSEDSHHHPHFLFNFLKAIPTTPALPDSSTWKVLTLHYLLSPLDITKCHTLDLSPSCHFRGSEHSWLGAVLRLLPSGSPPALPPISGLSVLSYSFSRLFSTMVASSWWDLGTSIWLTVVSWRSS